MAAPDYRLIIKLKDDSTGQVIESDFCTLTETDRIDEFGGCEVVDHLIAKMLRGWRERGRKKYERENYCLETVE